MVPSHSLKGLRVLILEDEYLIALDVEQLCRDHGAEDVSISRGIPDVPEGIPTPFDIAILDLMLNGETTLPFAERLHARGVPFIFATGYADATEKFAMFSGVPVVGKPYSSEELIGALVEATNTASA
ncbi:MAG TPA: response regulator [Rhizobiaceae bacterium]|nr:response regulator [Rhizobiaceae bacterium]